MFEREYTKALEACRKAGAIISRYYNSQYKVEEKGVDQPVTVADREANESIQRVLMETFPQDGWLSEESNDTPERHSKKRVWIVDPLDGTKEFISKVPEFAVSIALSVDSRIVVGAVFNPLTHELFSARLGAGAYLNDSMIEVTRKTELKRAVILASRSEFGQGEWKPYKGQFEIQPSGGMAYKMVMVARGRADGSFSLAPKNEWDFAAGTLILQEAGGVVSQLDGTPFVFNQQTIRYPGIVYGNPSIYQKLLALVQGELKTSSN